MATLSNGRLTLADMSKRTSPDGKISPMAELLSQQNDVLEDIVFKEANQPTSHVESIRTGLPDVYFRSYNQGVPTSKSATAQVTEPMAMAEARSYIDSKLLMLNGNSAQARMSEEVAFVESMNQKMIGNIFNGNIGVDPKSFTGLATRFSSTTAGNGNNVLLAGGAGSDNASIYFVTWDIDTVFTVYPKGSQAGLIMRDLGEEAVNDSNGNQFQAQRSLFQWDMGLVVKDWRYVTRIANIDLSDWIGVTGTQASTAATNVLKLMMKAIARKPNQSKGRSVFYCNRSIQEGLMIQAMEKSSAVLSIQDGLSQFGQEIQMLKFMGYPIRGVDQLGIAETLVV
jgi:hypothetical protein